MTKKLFIGLMTDDSLRSRLKAYQSLWTWPMDAQLVPPANFHLTLRFLGAADDVVVAKLQDWLRLVPIEPFDLELVRPGTFDGGIAWVGPTNNDRLETLRERVNAAVTWAGFAAPTERWTPHVTLARKCAHARPPPSALGLKWHVNSFSLVSSDGGRYVQVAVWPPSPSHRSADPA